jgi:DNA-binding Lrp family transcriptional regulator
MIEIEWKGQKISFTDMKDFIEFEELQKAENGNGEETRAVIQGLLKDEKAIVKRSIALDHSKQKAHGWRKSRFQKSSDEIINAAVAIVDSAKNPIGITELTNRILGHHSGPDIARFRKILRKPIKDGFIKTWIGNRRQKYYSNKIQLDPDAHGYVRNKEPTYHHTERPKVIKKFDKRRRYGATMNTLLSNIDEIKLMYRTKNAKAIAKKFGLSEYAVRNSIFILQKQGKLQKKRYPGKQEEHIKFVYENMDKMTRGDLARALGVKRNTISNYMWHLKKRGKISDVEAKADIEKPIFHETLKPEETRKPIEPQYMQRDHPITSPKCVDCGKPLPLGHGHVRCFDCNQLRLKERESGDFSWDVMTTGNVSSIDLQPIIERMISHKEALDYLALSTALKPNDVSWKNFEKIINKIFLYQKEIIRVCNGKGRFVYNSNLKQVEFRGDLA